MWRLLIIPLMLCWCGTAFAAEPLVLDVWPGNAPGEKGDGAPESFAEQKPNQRVVKRLQNVSKPTITVYRPAKDKDTGAAVLIAPGGGYSILAWDLEGTEVAEYLNSIGVTGIVLKYRVPRRASDPKEVPPLAPFQDAQRAMSLVRSKAKEWGIDPNRIGMLGFSAGGHLTARTATNSDSRSYDKIDPVDDVSCRPDFVVLVYPAYLVNKEGNLAPEIKIGKNSPPCFFAHAYNDGISPENSLRMALALKQNNVNAEVHIYSTGGHGFGLRKSEDPCCTWPDRCTEWFKKQGYLGTEKK